MPLERDDRRDGDLDDVTAVVHDILLLPVTGSWDSWASVTVQVDLPAGDDPVTLYVGPNDSGSVNADSLTIN